MRPDPLCQRSARSLSVNAPVTSQSFGPISPPPSPEVGSLLVTETIRHVTVPPHASEADAVMATGTMSWFADVNTLGVAVTDAILGGVMSRTLTRTSSVADPPFPSVTVNVNAYDPAGRETAI